MTENHGQVTDLPSLKTFQQINSRQEFLQFPGALTKQRFINDFSFHCAKSGARCWETLTYLSYITGTRPEFLKKQIERSFDRYNSYVFVQERYFQDNH